MSTRTLLSPSNQPSSLDPAALHTAALSPMSKNSLADSILWQNGSNLVVGVESFVGEKDLSSQKKDFEDLPVMLKSSSDCVPCSDHQTVAHVTSSDQSIVCRICHLTASESNSPLEETGCECRGALKYCHRRCVEHWMLVKMSKQCEICQHPFQYDIIIPELHAQPGDVVANGVHNQMSLQSSCHDSRRFLFFVTYFLLLFTAATSIALSFFTREEYLKRRPLNVTSPVIEAAARGERMYAYGVSIAVTVFVGFHMIAVGILWVIAETVVLPKERLLKMHIMMFRTIYAAQLNEAGRDWVADEGSVEGEIVAGEEDTGRDPVSDRRRAIDRPERDSVRNLRGSLQRLVERRRQERRRRVQEVLVQTGSSLMTPESFPNGRVRERVTHVLRPSNTRQETEDSSAERRTRHSIRIPTANEVHHELELSRAGNITIDIHGSSGGQLRDARILTEDSAAEDQRTTVSEVHVHVMRKPSDRENEGSSQTVEMRDLADEVVSKSESTMGNIRQINTSDHQN